MHQQILPQKNSVLIAFIVCLVFTVGCKTPARQHPPGYNGEQTLIIFDRKQIFTNNHKPYTDTLSARYFYEVLTKKEAIRRYTGIKAIKKVIVIN